MTPLVYVPPVKGAKDNSMGRIVTSVTVANPREPGKTIRCQALVDTGTSLLILPSAWKSRLGDLERVETGTAVTASQQVLTAEVFGPVRIQIEGFAACHGDVVFIDMEPEDGVYEPLIGYIPLEQSRAAVDMVNHRLIKVHLDLK